MNNADKIDVLINKIRSMPNRDDYIKATLMICDGGGVGCFDVIKLLEELKNEIQKETNNN